MTDRTKQALTVFLIGVGFGVGVWLVHAPGPRPPEPPPPSSPASSEQPAGPEAGKPDPASPPIAFRDVTRSAGISFRHVTGASGRRYLPETMGAGVVFFDYDRDGDPDLFLVQSGPLPGYASRDAALDAADRLYRNGGDGSFEDVTAAAGLGKRKGYGQGACAADYDNDGWIDLYVTCFGKNVLYRNRGDGTFEDATERARVGHDGWSTSACFFDAERDGDLDLYVCTYVDLRPDLSNHKPCVNGGHPSYCSPEDFGGDPDVYYRNQGDGTFVDATREAGFGEVERGETKALGVVAGDLTGDGFPDLFVANDLCPNLLYVNRGDGTFVERGLEAGCALSEDGRAQAGMGVDLGDFDGDLDLDICVTNYQKEYNALYRNDTPHPDPLPGGEGALFADVSFTTGFGPPSIPRLGFGCDLLDYDQDGRLDFVVANGHVMDNVELYDETATYAQANLLLRGAAGSRFEDATARDGGPGFEPRRVGRGLATADYDGDGDLDIALANGGGDFVLLRAEGAGSPPAQNFAELLQSAEAPDGRIPATLAPARAFARDSWLRQLWPASWRARGLENSGPRAAGGGAGTGAGVRPPLPPGEGRGEGAGTGTGTGTGPGRGHWLILALEGTRSNRSAVGARVTVRAGGLPLVDEVRAGSSYLSQNDLRLHFGLGAATVVDSVEIRWPSGLVEKVERLPADRVYTLREGDARSAAPPASTKESK